MTLFAAYVWQPPNLEAHLISRLVIGCIFLLWACQTVLIVWTLKGLDAFPDNVAEELRRSVGADVEMQNTR